MKFEKGNKVLVTFRGIQNVAQIKECTKISGLYFYQITGTGYPENWWFKEEYLELIV